MQGVVWAESFAENQSVSLGCGISEYKLRGKVKNVYDSHRIVLLNEPFIFVLALILWF